MASLKSSAEIWPLKTTSRTYFEASALSSMKDLVACTKQRMNFSATGLRVR
jgi:hypothetical protein